MFETKPALQNSPRRLTLSPMRFRLQLDQERCKGCGVCVPACERGLLTMSNDLNRKGYHYVEFNSDDGCGGCLQCTDVCPECGIAIERIDEES